MSRNSLKNIQAKTSISLLLHPWAYIEGLLGSDTAKTCNGMAQRLQISHDVLQKILDAGPKTADELRKLLIQMGLHYSNPYARSFLIVDDTLLVKEFSYILEQLGLINSANSYDNQKGYKIVVMIWTDGKITIPIDFKIWIDGLGKTKIELAQDMIIENYKKIPFAIALMDGLYPSEEMLKLLDSLSIKFIMRLPKNRKIRKSMNELEAKIGDHWQYKLKGNTRIKLFEGFIQGVLRYITVYKQKNRKCEYETRYLISNFKETAKNILVLYKFRWTIEKFFRTVKQKLGIQDCQSRSIEGQKNHIWAVFAAYAIADAIKLNEGYETTDQTLRMIRRKNQNMINLKDSSWTIFSALA